jgi:hypothetical protein
MKLIIVEPLTIIINQMLNTGIFPNLLKIAKVTPIYKKGDETDFSNYRPISLLPALSKIFEKVIFNQTYEYFTQEKLFYESQYGFRNKHSTEYAALEIVDRLMTEMDKNETPINIYLDLSKAFDTLDHNTLIQKLEYYGIKGNNLALFQNYLTERKQYVEFNNTKSEMLEINTGVPQGSILGPLLFIIYINDMSKVSKIFAFIIYADDTTLSSILSAFKARTNQVNIETKINNELSKICIWLTVNKLSLNVGKTKFTLFHTKQKKVKAPIIKINDNIIERLTDFNFLGLIINENLSWKSHANKISNSISKTTGVLNRLKNLLPQKIKITLYNSMIVSHLNYCILAWGYEHSRLTKIQKRVIRTISLSKYNDHTEPIFKNLKLLQVKDILKVNEIKFYYKLENEKLPAYFLNKDPLNKNIKHCTPFCLKLNNEIHTHKTRSSNKLHITRTNHSFAQKCLRQNLPLTINETPTCILNRIKTHSIQRIAADIKTLCIDKYEEICNVQNCYICNKK